MLFQEIATCPTLQVLWWIFAMLKCIFWIAMKCLRKLQSIWKYVANSRRTMHQWRRVLRTPSRSLLFGPSATGIFWVVLSHFRTDPELQVCWIWASELIICSLSSSSFWKFQGKMRKVLHFSWFPKKLWKVFVMNPARSVMMFWSVWVRWEVSNNISSLNKRQHEKPHRSWKMKSQIGQENERLGSFCFAGRWKCLFNVVRSTLLPTSTLRAPKVERGPSNANLYFWALSKNFGKVVAFYFLSGSYSF